MKRFLNSSMVRAGALAALLIAFAVAAMMLPLKDSALALVDAVEGLGWIGIIAFILIYVVAVVLLLPVWPLTISAGLAYGLWAIPLVVVTATVGAALAFLVARRVLRQWVSAWARRQPYVDAVDRAVKVEGWKVVGLLRLSPVFPFNLQNYFFGATSISATDFVTATFFGIIPGTAMYVYIGTLGRAAVLQGQLSTGQIVLFAIGLLATVIAVVIIARKAKLALSRMGVARNGTGKGSSDVIDHRPDAE
jgi:uncharacterized membrane protein YdjX (TVP38/TMEM64 family)